MQRVDYGRASRYFLSISQAIVAKRFRRKVRFHFTKLARAHRRSACSISTLLMKVLVRQKLNIINDHITEDKEDFDLNLFPTVFGRGVTAEPGSNETSKSNLSLKRSETKNSIVDTIWSSRKQSSATNVNMDIGSGMSRVSTLRSERSDSVVGGAIEEEGKSLQSPAHTGDTLLTLPIEPWSEGLSDFKNFKEEDYLSPDF